MVRPLVFNTPAPTPAPKANTGGKPLVFAFPPSAPPLSPVTVDLGERKEPVKRLAFPPAPAPKPTQHTAKAVFEQQLSPLAKRVIDILKVDHADAYAKNGPYLERQVNQLVPLDVSKIMNWSATTLQGVTHISSACMDAIREFTAIGSTAVIDETLKIITGKLSFFEKLTHNHTGQVTTKPMLQVAKTRLNALLVDVSRQLTESESIAGNLMHKMTTLRVIGDVCGKLPDAALDDALHERQMLITQAATQAQLATQQLQDVRRQVVDHLSRIEQLLIATIPAYETAQAHR